MNDDAPDTATLARRRAEAAGLDLDALRRSDPQRWRMLHAAEALRVAPELLGYAGPLLSALYPEAELFEVPVGRWRRILTYPPQSRTELERLDRPAGDLAGRLGGDAYYRVVEDPRGVRRELGVPLAPEGWRPEPARDAEALVGPFADEASARDWAEATVMGRGEGNLTYDTFAHGGEWFADVFRGDLQR